MEHLGPALEPVPGRGMRVASLVTVAVMAATLTLTACSSSSKHAGSSGGSGGTGSTQTAGRTPAQAVVTAFRGVGDQSSMHLSFSLPLTAAQFQQLWSTMGHGTMPQAEAQALSTASVFFSASTGHGESLYSSQANHDTDMSYDLGLTVNGDTPVELRYVGHALYIHLLVGQAFADFGQPDSNGAKQVQSMLQLGEQYVPGLRALDQGKWVEVSQQTFKSLEPFLRQMGQNGQQGAGTHTTPSTSQAATVIGKLRSDLLRALDGNVTVADLGKDQGRTKYTATLNLSNFLATAKPKMQADLAGLPGGSMLGSLLFRSTRPVPPGRTLVTDIYVTDNKVSEVDLDARQFMSKNPGFAVPVRIAVGGAGPITAPPGAVQLDLSKLPVIIQGLLGQLGGTSSTTTG